jgi:hypothetical protein
VVCHRPEGGTTTVLSNRTPSPDSGAQRRVSGSLRSCEMRNNTPGKISIFRSPEAEAQFPAAYEAVLKQWPVPYQELYIPTRFGRTHVVVGGPGEAPPLAATRPICGHREFMDWMSDLFEGLQIDRAHLVGNSNRGFFALETALYLPELVVRRATRRVAGLKAERVPNANHSAQYKAPDAVNARILAFLDE